jgi:hypothetical protein
MTTRYSPAPWHYRVSENCPDVWEIIADFCEFPIAEVPRQQDEDGNDSEEAEANACLMTAAPKLLAACQMVVDRWERGDLAEAARVCNAAIAEAEAATPPTAAPGNKPYSVLLLYPDYLDDTGYETYYAFVEALEPIEAVAVAQRQAIAAQCVDIDDPTDFAPLLVTEGHHASKPLFNK